MQTVHTIESARAAIALGPVQFVCNVCGEIHSTDDASQFWLCVRRRCSMVWDTIYRTHQFRSVYDAATAFEREFHHSDWSETARGDVSDDEATTVADALADIRWSLDPAAIGDHESDVVLLLVIAFFAHELPVVLMIPNDIASLQVAVAAANPIIADLCSQGRVALHAVNSMQGENLHAAAAAFEAMLNVLEPTVQGGDGR